MIFLKSMEYEILEHRADLKIKVRAKNPKELFRNAMVAMFESAGYEPRSGSQDSRVKIKIKSVDSPSLLVDFLSECLYLSETRKEVYQSVEFEEFTEQTLEGHLIGKKLKRVDVQIKGVTYHSLKIEQRKGNIWTAVILFDI